MEKELISEKHYDEVYTHKNNSFTIRIFENMKRKRFCEVLLGNNPRKFYVEKVKNVYVCKNKCEKNTCIIHDTSKRNGIIIGDIDEFLEHLQTDCNKKNKKMNVLQKKMLNCQLPFKKRLSFRNS